MGAGMHRLPVIPAEILLAVVSLVATAGAGTASVPLRAEVDDVQTASTPFRGGDRAKTLPITRGA